MGEDGAGPVCGISGNINDLFADLGKAMKVQLALRTTFEASFNTPLSGDEQTYAGGPRLSIHF